MKILFVYGDYEELGGVTAHINQLSKFLKDIGHEVIKLSFEKGGVITLRNKLKKYNVKNLFVDRQIVEEFFEIVEDITPDIIHVHHRSTCMATARVAFKKVQEKLRIPIVATMHGFGISGCLTAEYVMPNGKFCDGFHSYKKCIQCKPGLKGLIISFLHKEITVKSGYIPYFKQFDKVIVPSKILQKYCEIRGIYNTVHLPNFAEIKTLKNMEIPFNDFYLFIGRLTKQKGIVELINTYNKFTKSKFFNNRKLIIIGDGPLREFVLKNTQNNKNIIFLGKKRQEEIIPYYKNAYCLIVPSIWLENHSLVLLEGSFYDVPVVTTNRGGNSEIVKHNYNGINLDVSSREELEKALYDFFIKYDNLDHLRNKKPISNYITGSQYAEELTKIYKGCILKYENGE
jgi:glycosyltransferase involved in cell wall biosynthesis